MIPRSSILAWQENIPWIEDKQIEQDLILSRILVEIFSDPLLKQALAFRGGTALHKLFFKYPLRYSEDIDLVRTNTGPIKKIVDALRNKLDGWLGVPTSRRNSGRFKLYYKFETETPPITQARIKIEINTRERFTCMGFKRKHFKVDSAWFTGGADVLTYELEELLGTKLRALYQRKKGRDLFDLAIALETEPAINIEKIIECFKFYLNKEEKKISVSEFTANITAKLNDQKFVNDTKPLLARAGFPHKFPIRFYPNKDHGFFAAAQLVQEKIITQLI